MSLLDSLGQPDPVRRPSASHPAGWEPGIKYETGEVTLQLPEPPSEEEAQWRSEIKRVTGLDLQPSQRVTLVETRYWGDPASPNVYARFRIEETPAAALDLDELVRAATANRPYERGAWVDNPSPTAYVVALADLQVGKTGSRGGSAHLVDRVMAAITSVENHLATIGPDFLYVLDAGDLIESVENTSAQLHTNDLSVPEQLRVARRLLTEAITRWSAYAGKVVVAGVPSNHCRWRRGKGALGKPSDDFGLETLTAVADALQLAGDAYSHVSFVVPDTWDETLVLDVNGLTVGLAHGHQVNRPEQIPLWWAKQTHGGQPLAHADLLLTGHFHSFRLQYTGRSPHTGRAKLWVQCPTLDAGSDWYRGLAGEDSDPGLLTFVVRDARAQEFKIH